MSSPANRIAALAAAAFVISAAAPAYAASDADARSAAIVACKAAVATQLSADVADVRIDRITTRGRTIELRLDVRKDGARAGLAACTYNRRAETAEVVIIEPATNTATN